MSKQLESILSRAPRATAEPAIDQPAQPTSRPSPTLKAFAPEPTPKPSPEPKSRDVSLGIEVPESVKRAVSIKAATEGVTNRTLLLRALQGIGITIPDEELRDRRK